MASFDRRLKSILMKNRTLDEQRRTQALSTATSGGKSLSEVLIENDVVSERELIASVAGETNLPPVDLGRIDPDPEALECMTEELASSYGMIPLSRLGNNLTMAVSNPCDILKLDDIAIITGCQIRPVVSTDVAVRKAIVQAYHGDGANLENIVDDMGDPDVEVAEEPEEDDVDISQDLSGSSPLIKLVNTVIHQAVQAGASDIHIEPFEKKIRIRFRKDGKLHETTSPPLWTKNALVSRIKIMSNLDIAEKRRPQDGKFQVKVDGRKIDFRVSILPVVNGEKVVMRILDTQNLSVSLDKLGFEPKSLSAFRDAVNNPHGMILVTGPTGSGKSTTLYSSLREVMSDDDNIVTVEDPVEYQIDGINQVGINTKQGMTFAGALRSILRQDPDIIMIGEIRDRETVDIAVKAAITGHLVLSTLHTNDAPSTIDRMIDMGVDPFMVASATLLVSAQRLIRRLCPECKARVHLPKERLIGMQFTEEEAETAELFRPVGCQRCSGGYKGRFALLETLPISEGVRRLIVQGQRSHEIKRQGLEEGMITLRRCAILNALRGNTSVEEVLNVTTPD